MLINTEAPPKLRLAAHEACCAFADRAPFTFLAKSKAIFHIRKISQSAAVSMKHYSDTIM